MAPSHCERLVAVMRALEQQRSRSQIFAGKHGFITLRDLFRWALRAAQSHPHQARSCPRFPRRDRWGVESVEGKPMSWRAKWKMLRFFSLSHSLVAFPIISRNCPLSCLPG